MKHQMHPLRALGRWDRRVFDVVAASRTPALGRIFPSLTRSADNAVMWAVIAGALAVAGGPRLRRAALRGSLALSMVSPIANGSKRLFRRARPRIDGIPPIRLARSIPRSPAFPSGHSASAAAFAVGIAAEAPVTVSGPVALLAAAVASSRVYTGAHYPGDVLAGAALGVTAGLVAGRLLPPARAARSAARLVSAGRLDAAADGDGLVAVINEGSGGGTASGEPDLAALLCADLPHARIVRAGPGDDLDGILDTAASRATVLAVAGGDGTIGAGARAAVRYDVPLLIVPSGTHDHFARTIGMLTCADAVAAFRAGRLARVDVGVVEGAGASFVNTASFGAYAELVDHRERLAGRWGTWPALAVGVLRVLRRAETVTCEVDGQLRNVWVAFVGNCRYTSRGVAPARRDRLADGLLDVRLVTVAWPWPRMRAAVAILAGHLGITRHYIHWRAHRLTLRSADGPLRIATDGETRTATADVTFTKRRRALRVVRPG